MTYDEVVDIGLKLPDVAESTYFGTPALKRKGRWMLRLKEDGESIAVKLDWETHDRLLEEFPQVYFKTPHYSGYPVLLAQLEALDAGKARILLGASWEDAPNPARALAGLNAQPASPSSGPYRRQASTDRC